MSSYIKSIVENEQALNEIAQRAFQNVDKDKNKFIDEYELEKIMAQISNDMGAEPPTKEDVKEVLDSLDTDRNGTINFDEFKALIKDILNALIE